MQCRICFEEGGEFLSPCDCRGTSAYIHPDCLDRYFEHYPDRICRVCRSIMTLPRSKREWVYVITTCLFVHALLLASGQSLLFKLLALIFFWNVGVYYVSIDLFSGKTFLGLLCLWGLFLPGGNYQAITTMLLAIGGIALMYTLFVFVPPQYVFRMVTILLLFLYAAFLAMITLTSMDTPTFVLYLTSTFLIWYAGIQGANPVRLIMG